MLFSIQSKQLIDNTRSSTAALSNMVEANLRHALQDDNWVMVKDIVRLALTERTIDSLRIINTQGNVLASSNQSEVGLHYDQQDPLCQQCHAFSPRTTNRIGGYNQATKGQMLFTMNLIENGPECFTCHAPEKKVLGLQIIETPLTEVNNQLAAGFSRTTSIALIACVVLVGLLVPVLNRYVIQPVEALSKGVDELTSGNLDYEVKPINQDELGKLAESFDQMRRQLKNSYQEIAQRESEAVSLYRMGTKISASLSMVGLLDCVAEASRELLKVDVGMVGLFDEESQEIIFNAAAGVRAEAHKGIRMPVSPGTPGHALLEGKPVLAEAYDQNNLLHQGSHFPDSERTVSILAVPLQLGNKFMGVIEVMNRNHRQFTQADAQLLVRLAHPAVISIENAQLYQQLRYLSTLEERDRLAREMHDDLAQILGYLNVRASMVDDLLSSGSIPEAKESLTELKRVARRAYTDVREEIFKLRTTISPGNGFLPALTDYLSDYQVHYGLETKLLCECDSLADVPDEVATQLIRIIQEALTNVRKHAHASQAFIRFVQEGDRVCIQVEDNGQGFYPDQALEVSHQSYGLQIMRERAASVGGSLSVESKPGHGTCVTVFLPQFTGNGRKVQ
jgi:nitrate/nitrite-specific signal transduction histidine kinase